MEKYIHTEEVHNLKDPNVIVPLVINLLKPSSVVDIGCGVGNFLKIFKNKGVQNILGVDGKWANRDLLQKHISLSEFIERDLEKPLKLNEYYDLVVNLEVAEHLSEKSAEIHVQNLIAAGKLILFSAAIPYQPGQNHINEQWLTYWKKLFEKYNYKLHDIMRPLLWNLKCQTCYKQNMVVFAPIDYEFKEKLNYTCLNNVVHPELYNYKVNQLERINEEYKKLLNGKISYRLALKMILKGLIGIEMWEKLKTMNK